MVLTPFNQEALDDPQVREQQVQSVPMKRAAEPSEVGRLAVFLASDDASYVTGSSYVMDGGLMQNQARALEGRFAGDSAVSLGAMVDELPELILADAEAWRRWLEAHHGQPDGVWLVLAKKGTTAPTSLTYDEALDEALCQGWIDGQAGRRDDATYRQRFTPRRAKSAWSARNVGIVGRLLEQGRMQPAGLWEVERAQADGRWEAAYAGQASMEVPADLADALAAEPAARAMFDSLTRQNRFAILYRIQDAKRPATRQRRIEQFVAMLARGETRRASRAAQPPT